MLKIKGMVLLVVTLLIIACSTDSEDPKYIIPENNYSIQDVAYAGTIDTVFYAKQNGKIYHQVKDQEPTLIVDLDEEVHLLAYNKRAKKIYASTYQSGIAVIDEEAKKVLKRLPVSGWSHSILYHDNTNKLISVGTDSEITIWEVTNDYETEILDLSQQLIAVNAHQGSMVIFSGMRGNIFLYDLEAKEVINEGNVQAGVNDESAYFNGKLIWSRNTSNAYLVDVDSMKVVGNLKHPNWPIKANDTSYVDIPVTLDITGVAIADDEVYTASADRSIRVWSLPDPKVLKTLRGHKGIISTIKLNQDRTQLVSASLRNEIKFWTVGK